jgi:CSLREA domain-containing protein
MQNRTSILRLTAIFLLTLAVTAPAATITVNSAADAGGTCPGTNCTLRQAIAAALSGDTIAFSLPSKSAVSLTSGELLVNKNLTIIGPGADLLSVQRDASASTNFLIFEVAASSNVTISGLTITNGNGGFAGGIYNAGTLTINNATISGNSTAFDGGGIYNGNTGTLTITNATISGNTANVGGGIVNDAQAHTVTIASTTISGNTATANGGGIESYQGTVTITDSTVSGNSAGSDGGGMDITSGTVSSRNTIIAKNTAPSSGPDVFGALTSQGYNLIGNNSGASIAPATGDKFGVAAFPIDPMLGPLQDNGGPTKTQALLYGSPAIDQGKYSGSSTDQRGYTRPVDLSTISNASGGDGNDIGAYEVQANDQPPGCNTASSVVSSTNDSGTDSLRGVIANVCAGSTITFAATVRGAITLTSAELLINKSLTINGPGANLLSVQRSASASTNFRIFNIADHLIVAISGLTIANGNRAGNFGGGIFNNNSVLTLTNATISGNTADIGAGIYTGRAATITNSTISNNIVSGNLAGDGGGGIYNQGGTLSLTSSTISGNKAQITGGGGQGGAIHNNLGTVTLTNSTISGNSADFGGGIYNSNNGTVNSKNTIMALNTSPSGPDVNGALTSQGYNLIGDNSGASIAPATGDQIGSFGASIDPMLGQLGNNGGPTQTHALLSGSFAIDKGNSNGLSKDQRGFPRPIDFSFIANATNGDGSDIGAFEVQPATTLANISTRLRVETGDNVLIGGFIVTGTQPKKVILLAIGPSLPLADTLTNPTLELYSGNTLLQSNDDWVNSPDKQAIMDSGVAPTNNLESAIIATLPANNAQYTAIVRGANNTTGIGVVQAYDLDRLADSKLANISTRGLVQTGDNVLIAGTIIVGQASQKVIIRALGPSTGVPGAMADPTLELHDANGGIIESNDNWVDSPNKQAIIDSTIPPTNNLESAIVRTLAPANYTAILRGVNNTTGIAVVEVYALQ